MSDEPLPFGLLNEALDAQFTATPDLPAVIQPSGPSGAHTVDFKELDARSNQLARHLLALGVRPWENTLVGVYLPRSVESITTITALLKIGAPYVPLDPAYPAHHLKHIVSTAALSWVITNTSQVELEVTPTATQTLLAD